MSSQISIAGMSVVLKFGYFCKILNEEGMDLFRCS